MFLMFYFFICEELQVIQHYLFLRIPEKYIDTVVENTVCGHIVGRQALVADESWCHHLSHARARSCE